MTLAINNDACPAVKLIFFAYIVQNSNNIATTIPFINNPINANTEICHNLLKDINSGASKFDALEAIIKTVATAIETNTDAKRKGSIETPSSNPLIS